MVLQNRRGNDHPAAKFEPEEAEALCRKFQSEAHPSIREVAKALEVSRNTVYKIVTGLSYPK